MNYDPGNFESVMVCLRDRYGADAFKNPGRLYSSICDLSPKLKPYGNVMRQLAERGVFRELDAASTAKDAARQSLAIAKARRVLEEELLLSDTRADCFLGVLRTLYGLTPPAPSPQPVQPAPQPVPTSGRIVKFGECGDDVKYTLDENGVLTFYGHGPMKDFSSEYAIPWRYEREAISHVKIPDGVTKIGTNAFYRCTGLTSLTIPGSVTEIGEYAFSGCTGLTSLAISDSVTQIGTNAFSGCTGLTSVTIPDSVTEIESFAFEGCTGLTSLAIPDGVASIGYGAFHDCTGLTSVTISDGVTKIGEAAFGGCKNLKSVTIPDSVTEIGMYAFDGCESLKSVTVPEKARIGYCAFSYNTRVFYNVPWAVN